MAERIPNYTSIDANVRRAMRLLQADYQGQITALDDQVTSGTYTPSTTVTIGTGGSVNTASYVYSKGIIVARGLITLGSSGASVSSPANVSLPSGYTFKDTTARPVGMARLVNPGDAGYPAYLEVTSSTAVQFKAFLASSTYLKDDNVSSVVPFTWGSTDRFEWQLVAGVNAP